MVSYRDKYILKLSLLVNSNVRMNWKYPLWLKFQNLTVHTIIRMILHSFNLILQSNSMKKYHHSVFLMKMSVSKKVSFKHISLTKKNLSSRKMFGDVTFTKRGYWNFVLRCSLCHHRLGIDGFLWCYIHFVHIAGSRRSCHWKWKMQNLPRLFRQTSGYDDLCWIQGM